MNYVDYIVLSIFGTSILFGFVRGFVGSFLSFFGWLLSIYLSYALFPEFKVLLDSKIKNSLVLMMVGHSVLLIAFLIIFGVLNLFATTAVSGLTKGSMDRSIGALFGAFRAFFIVSFVFFVSVTALTVFSGNKDDKKFNDSLPKILTSAKTYPLLIDGKNIVADFIPNDFYKGIKSAYEQFANKTSDQRFMETMMQKLSQSISSDKLAEIQNSAHSESASKDEVQKSKLGKMLDEFHSDPEASSNSIISDDDVNKLQNLIGIKKYNAQPSNVELHAE